MQEIYNYHQLYMKDIIIKKLIGVILVALDQSYDVVDITSDDVFELERIALKHNIVPIISIGLKKLKCTEFISDSMIELELKSIYDYTQRSVAFSAICSAFEYASIPYLPLKGIVLSDLYPTPWMRTSSDIDILVKDEELSKAIAVLEKKTNFKYLKKEHHDAHLINDHVHLELHFSVLSTIDMLNVDLDNPWGFSVRVNNTYRYEFQPEYNLFYIVSHAAKHFIVNGGMGIRPLLDIYQLKKNTIYNEDKVKEFCANAGILDFYNLCCKLLDVWFNDGTHDEISKCFEEVVISGGVFGSKRLSIVSQKRHYKGKNYLLSRVFMPAEDLKTYYPICRSHPFLLPIYQLIRWTHILNPKTAKRFVEDNKYADSIDNSEVEIYDKLLKAIGFNERMKK